MRFVGEFEWLQEQVAALNFLEGLPKPPEVIGRQCEALVSLTEPGPGWTMSLAEVVDLEDGLGAVYLPDDIVAMHNGKTVGVDGREVLIALVAEER